jgi:hypothetical protein
MKRLKVEGSKEWGLKRREEKWSEVKWSEVKWSEVKWSEVKWSEVKSRSLVEYVSHHWCIVMQFVRGLLCSMLSHCCSLCVFYPLLCSNYSSYVLCYSFYICFLVSFVCFLFYILCLLCFYIPLCIVSPHVHNCFFSISVQVYLPLPPRGNPKAVNKYRIWIPIYCRYSVTSTSHTSWWCNA